VPKPDALLSAVVVSGGKQYRVAPGDRILVDRLAAEPGSSVKLDRVLLVRDGSDIKVGGPTIDGMDVDAKVLAHSRGPRRSIWIASAYPAFRFCRQSKTMLAVGNLRC